MATMMLIVGACFIVNGQADTTMRKGTVQSDAAFVAKNIKDNQNEIEMSQMALDKSQNQKIKTLAQQMVKDHTKMLEDLKKLEGNVGDRNENMNDAGTLAKPGDTGTASNQIDIAGRKTSKTDTITPGEEGADTSGTTQQEGADTSAMNHRGSDHHSAMMNASGNEFDSMWVSHMLDAHSMKLDELTLSSTNLMNPELKDLVQQAIPKVKMHKDRLEMLNKKGRGKLKGKS
jgi:predicted outer membrane protein